MKTRLDEINTLTVAKRSASGAVTATVGRTTGITVRLNGNKLSGHDEYSLAEEVEDVVLSAWNGRVEAIIDITRRHGIELRTKIGDVPNTTKKFLAEIQNAEVLATSVGKNVEVRLYGDCDLVIRFCDNAVRRTDISTSQLESDLNNAISNAVMELKKKMKATAASHRRILES